LAGGAASKSECSKTAEDRLFCQLLQRQQVDAQTMQQASCDAAGQLQKTPGLSFLQVSKAPEDELAKEMTHDLEMNFNKIAPFGKEDTAKELQDHAAKTQDTLVDAVENAKFLTAESARRRARQRNDPRS
jgi:hypothetical protein